MADWNSIALDEDMEEALPLPNGPRPNGAALRALPDGILERMLDVVHVVSDCEEEAEFRMTAEHLLVDIERAIAAQSFPVAQGTFLQ